MSVLPTVNEEEAVLSNVSTVSMSMSVYNEEDGVGFRPSLKSFTVLGTGVVHVPVVPVSLESVSIRTSISTRTSTSTGMHMEGDRDKDMGPRVSIIANDFWPSQSPSVRESFSNMRYSEHGHGHGISSRRSFSAAVRDVESRLNIGSNSSDGMDVQVVDTVDDRAVRASNGAYRISTSTRSGIPASRVSIFEDTALNNVEPSSSGFPTSERMSFRQSQTMRPTMSTVSLLRSRKGEGSTFSSVISELKTELLLKKSKVGGSATRATIAPSHYQESKTVAIKSLPEVNKTSSSSSSLADLRTRRGSVADSSVKLSLIDEVKMKMKTRFNPSAETFVESTPQILSLNMQLPPPTILPAIARDGPLKKISPMNESVTAASRSTIASSSHSNNSQQPIIVTPADKFRYRKASTGGGLGGGAAGGQIIDEMKMKLKARNTSLEQPAALHADHTITSYSNNKTLVTTLGTKPVNAWRKKESTVDDAYGRNTSTGRGTTTVDSLRFRMPSEESSGKQQGDQVSLIDEMKAKLNTRQSVAIAIPHSSVPASTPVPVSISSSSSSRHTSKINTQQSLPIARGNKTKDSTPPPPLKNLW